LGAVAAYRISPGLFAALAVPCGILAVVSPPLAVAGFLALGFIALAARDIAIGVAAFSVLALLEQVPPVAGTPAIKLAGAVLVVLSLRRELPLLRLLHELPLMAYAAVFLVTWSGVSILWAEDPGAAFASTFRLALGVVFAFVVYGAIRERKHVLWLTYAFVSGAIIVLLVGAPEGIEGGRFGGAVGNPNELASTLVPALALGGFALASGRSRRAQILLGASLVIIMYALLLTGSRGGLVALAAALVTAVILGGAFRVRIVAVLVVAVGLGIGYYAVLAPQATKDRLAEFTAEGGAGRLDLWTVSTLVAADRPALGVGAGNFPVVLPEYAAATVNLPQVRFIIDTPKVAHNTYLGLQAELGAPGLLAFLVIVGAALTSGIRAIGAAARLGDRELEYLSRGVVVALVGLLVSASFGSLEYHKQLWLLLGFTAAMSAVVSRSAGSGFSQTPLRG
jgi:O-antigen ligase